MTAIEICDFNGVPLKTETQGLKVRLASVYRKPSEGVKAIMDEIKALTETDLQDFARWFNEAGYPTTYIAAAA